MENITTEQDDAYKVPNLEKGIAILEIISLSQLGMTLQEVKQELDLSQTTTYRILNTLVRLGYLIYVEGEKRYVLSRKMLTVGFRSLQEQNLFEKVLPPMRLLRDELKETVCFGIMGSDKAIFIDQVVGSYPFCFVLTPGKSIDLHCSALGKAIMAFLPEKVQSEYLNKISYDIYTANTISNKTDYLLELDSVRANGYALDDEEELKGVFCIGAPILNYDGYPVASIWISGPSERIKKAGLKKICKTIKNTTQQISLSLGYQKK